MTTLAIEPVATLSLLPRLSGAASEAIDVDPPTLIARWLGRLSPTARRSYRLSLEKFAAWALEDGAAANPVQALQLLVQAGCGPAHEMVRRWRDELLAAGAAPGTVGCRVTGLASLCKALRQAGVIGWKIEGVMPKYERRCDRSGPRRGDVERLFCVIDDAAAAGDLQAVRDAAMIRLLYSAAMRRAEVVGLRLEDVDLDGAEGPVVRPKRKGKLERAPLLVGSTTAAALRRWLEARGPLPGAVFCSVRHPRFAGKAMQADNLRRVLDSWRRRAGIKARIRPHGLRHSSATTIAKRGSLAQLMALGGWSSFSAAQRYLDEHAEERRSALLLVEV